MTLYLYLIGFILHILVLSLLLRYCCRVTKIWLYLSISVLPTLCWVFYNPLYTQGPRLEFSYRHIDANDGTNWPNSFTFQAKKVVAPTSLEMVQNVVQNNRRVRVIGGGHSWAPLIETNDTLIDMKYFDTITVYDHYVVAGAGVTLQRLSNTLADAGKMFRGYGSVKEQTIGGSCATSLHGDQPDTFSTHITHIKAVLANGSLIDTDNMRMWRDNMGLLGVMYEFNITIFTLQYVDVNIQMLRFGDIEKLMKEKTMFDAVAIASRPSKYDEIYFRTRTAKLTETDGDQGEGASPQERSTYYLYDAFLLPCLTLFSGIIDIFDLTFVIVKNQNYTNIPITDAWAHPAEFGFLASEYSIPLEHCSKAFQEMFGISPSVVSYELRVLDGASHCMSWVSVESCAINVSPFNLNNWGDLQHSDFFRRIEDIAFKYGGSAHLGKHIAGALDKQVASLQCFDEFNQTRTALDPTNKFVNRFAEEYVFLNDHSQERYYDKTFRHLFFSFLTYIAYTGLVLSCCIHCCAARNHLGRRHRGYSPLALQS